MRSGVVIHGLLGAGDKRTLGPNFPPRSTVRVIAVYIFYTLRCTFSYYLHPFGCTLETMRLLSNSHFTIFASCDPSFVGVKWTGGSGQSELLNVDCVSQAVLGERKRLSAGSSGYSLHVQRSHVMSVVPLEIHILGTFVTSTAFHSGRRSAGVTLPFIFLALSLTSSTLYINLD